MMTPKDRSWAIAEHFNLTPACAMAIEMAILEALRDQTDIVLSAIKGVASESKK